MRKNVTAVLAAGVLMLGLAGCGESKIPELTDEQTQLIGEYAAFIVMKHDASQRSRLVDYTNMLEPPDPAVTQEPEQEEEPAGMDPVDNTPVIGSGGEGTESPHTMEEVLGLPEGMSVAYTGQTLCDIYPEDDESPFAMTAVEGRQFLVLEFTMINATGQDQSVDFLTLSPVFRITVNGDYTRRALMTMLENDLSVYEGTIPNMEGASAVLLIEVEDDVAANLSSISLQVKNGSETYTTQLL